MKGGKKREKQRAFITQKDVAKQAGVSSAVVSYVINNVPGKVTEDTRQRVLHAIAELNYHPHKYAQRLKARTTQAHRQVGIIFEGGANHLNRPYYTDVLASVYTEAYRQGQRIRFLHFFEELHDPILLNEQVNSEEISALLFLPMYNSLTIPENQELFQRISERIPNIVCLGRSVPNLPSVIFDKLEATRTALTHLLRLGHKRIGFVGVSDDRLIGYRQVLGEHGLPYEDMLVQQQFLANSPDDGYTGALHLLNLASPPTAIFASCDEVALGVLHAFYERGLQAPVDMALVSIDDLDFAALLCPALTTIRVPRRQMGIQALRMVAFHESYPDTSPASLVLPTELIIRQSCGAKKA